MRTPEEIKALLDWMNARWYTKYLPVYNGPRLLRWALREAKK